MKNNIKKSVKSLTAMLMALLIFISAFPITSFAATFITDMNSDAKFGVIDGSLSKVGHELHYAKYDGVTYLTFCAQYGVSSPDGSTYKYGKDFKKYVNREGAVYETIADYIAFGYTLKHGYGLPNTKQEWIDACCTQQYVWEKLNVNPTRSSWDSTYMSDNLYSSWKKETDDLINLYYKTKPSFNKDNVKINIGKSKTLTDSNGVFKYYPTFEKTTDKVTFSHTKGSNTLSINVADNCTTHSVGFNSASYKIYMDLPAGQSYDDDKMKNYVYFEFDDDNVQNLMFSNYVDPQTFAIDVDVQFGSLKVIKTSEDGIVSGIKFNVSGNGLSQDVTTNANGELQIDRLAPGTYTVTEETIDKYKPQQSQTVTVKNNETATVNFDNKLKRGGLSVVKNSEDNLNAGHKFHLYGTSLSGIKVDEYAVTDKNGIATFKNILIGSGYTLEEVETAIRYVVPDKQTTAVEWDKVTNANFTNKLKKFRVMVVKEDIENGKAQGDATLAGAVYGLYKGDKLVAQYTTDSNASFTTDYFPCGTDWTIREITASEGYLVNSKAYPVGADPKLYTVEYNDTSNKVQEQVVKGNISIIKHTDDGSTQIETPEKGAEFQLYLKSAGSFANAKNSEKDTLVCDEDGFASSKLLPYGVYTVHQTKGWDGREKIKDFDVFINKDGKTYKFLINNSNFASYLKVVKLDKETGKQIAYEGAGFEIYDSDGHRVSMQFTYPEVTEIHTFYTNSEGYLITPEKLPYGNYTLVEVQAPFGYVLDSTPIPFTINQENSSTDTGVTVVKVKARDVAQKGIIEITKMGEIFSSVIENEGVFTPVYEVGNLANAVFEIYAAEDIVTLDGTTRYYQGEKVDEITTDKNGVAKSKQLYLGKYTVVEKTAPDTFVNANEQYDVELAYAGQEVTITSSALSVYNERQKVSVSLSKAIEEDEDYNIGINDEILSVQFGIFADEDITAKDGSVIPADSLITFANCDKDGDIKFDCDLPISYKFYVKEIATDEHYILSNAKYEFNTDYKGQDIEVIEIAINDGEPIENTLKRGKVDGIKVGEENNGLGSALIGMFSPDTIEFTEENAIVTVISADDGSFTFEGIPYGEWIIKEITAPEGYVLDDTEHHIYITDDDVTINIRIENAKIRGNLEISKTDVSTGEALVNVGFRIYDKDKKIVAEGVTDENGICTFENLEYGEYFYQEFSCDDAYVIDDTLYPFSITENGVTIKAEMTNRIKQGQLVIHKVDSEDKNKVLAGVEFTVTDKDGNIIATAKTDKTGTVTFDLPYGEYIWFESKTLNGYILDAEKHEFSITDDGQVCEFTAENEKVTEKVKTPKTGDDRNYGTWLGLALVAAVGCTAGIAFKIKSKKEEDDE